MRPMKLSIAVTLIMGLGAIAVIAQTANRPGAKASTLTAMDYIQIKQLANRFAFAHDTGADNGCELANLFTADGEFEPDHVKGRDKLAALARLAKHGPLRTSLYTMNHLIEPSPEGARGKQYVIEIQHDDIIPAVPPGESQWNLVGQKRGSVTTVGGHYEDIYVKTTDGWRFKRREFVPSQRGMQPVPVDFKAPVLAPGPACGPAKKPSVGSLTAMDYLGIERVVASYGHALDNGYGKGENAEAYAGLYTRDASFGRTIGHDDLALLGSVQPHSATYVRHYLTNHVIEGTSDGGAKGKQYLVVIDISEGGQPGTIFLGGHYEDVYAKTADGWRIKTRTLFRAQSAPDAKAVTTR